MKVQVMRGERLSPLFRMASVRGLKDTVLLQLRKGEGVNATDHMGRTPLILAATAGHADLCRLLLEAGADSTLRDLDGNDALQLAKRHGHGALEAILRSAGNDGYPRAESSDRAGLETGATSDCS